MGRGKIVLIILFFLVIIVLPINLFATMRSTIEGVVYDKETGKPIEGVEVILYVYKDSASFPTKHLRTNKKGYFKMEGLFHGKYFISCYKSGYQTYSPIYKVAMPNYKKKLLIFKIKEGEVKYLKIGMNVGGRIKIEIKKKDENGIKAFEGVEVAVSEKFFTGDKRKYIYNEIGRRRTNSSGIVIIDGLEDGMIYDVWVSGMEWTGFPSFHKEIIVKKNKTVFVTYTYDYTDKTGIKGKIIYNKDKINDSISIGLIGGKKMKFISFIRLYKDNNYYFRMLFPGKYKIMVFYKYKNIKKIKHKYTKFINVKKNRTKAFEVRIK